MASANGQTATATDEATTSTVTQEVTAETLTLHLQQPAEDAPPARHVLWANDTVDNEFLGRKKSKCCCIYKKPKRWDESDDDESGSDCETDHCRGHVEKKKD